MPHTVIKLDGEPILLVRVMGTVTGYEYFKLSLEIANLLDGVTGKIYRISDLTGARIHFMDMIDIVAQITKGCAGMVSDPRMVPLVIMSDGNAFLGLAHLLRHWEGARRVHLFMGIAEALAYARAELAAQAEGKIRVMA